jgi:hypothetical protein
MKLTDTQLILLSAAAQRDDRAIEIPDGRDPAVTEKLVAKLAGAGLIEEVEAGASFPEWRRVEEIGYALRVTDKGLNAIGVDSRNTGAIDADAAGNPKPEAGLPRKKRGSNKTKAAGNAPAKQKTVKKPAAKAVRQPSAKRGVGTTKLDQVKALLGRKRGASIGEMMEATNWLPHTTRAVLTGLRKKGFEIEREAIKDKPTVYRIIGGESSGTAAERQTKRAA